MILGIGTDLANIERIERTLDRFGDRFRNRVFTDIEQRKAERRRDVAGTTRGLRGRHTHVLRADDGLLAYHRWDRGGPGDDVVVVVNLTTHPRRDVRLGLPRAGRWRVRCNTDAPSYGPGLGAVHAHDTDTEPRPWDGVPDSALLTVGPYAALVLSQDD